MRVLVPWIIHLILYSSKKRKEAKHTSCNVQELTINTPAAFHTSNEWEVMVHHMYILAGKAIENHPMMLSV